MGEAFSWRTAYVVGGVLGLLLLILRVKMFESGMYHSMKSQDIRKGDFFLLFKTTQRFFRYLCCIAIGLPIWFVIGILVTFSPEICAALGATGTVSAGTGILVSYAGLVVGDIGSGLVSQYLRSRRITVLVFIAATAALVALFLFSKGQSPNYYYFLCFLLGTAAGYWALFVTIAAEQFGTNLRATVATTAPNFVRGAVVPLTLSVQAFKGDFGLVESALAVGLLTIFLALIALHFLQESFGRDLEFFEK
jgi:MFS transporter, putative metabolite:H+ symporter